MKIFNLSIITICFLTLFISCDEINERVLPNITGKPGDLLVVLDTNYWNAATGEAVKNTFSTTIVGLPQREPKFNVMNIPSRSFSRLFHTTRNVLMIEIDAQEKPNISVRKDVWAEGQLIVTIKAPNDEVAQKTVEKNQEILLAYFNEKEIARLHAKYKKAAQSLNAKKLNKKFGLTLNIDDSYQLAQEGEDFIWLRHDQERRDKNGYDHTISKGIMIYTYPYVSDSTFEVKELVKKRNELTKQYVQGTDSTIYMQTYKEYIPKGKELNWKNIYVKELRGLWRMEGSFMGGPFASYTMVNEQENKVITIDSYVFAPNFDKREYMRELEALALTISF